MTILRPGADCNYGVDCIRQHESKCGTPLLCVGLSLKGQEFQLALLPPLVPGEPDVVASVMETVFRWAEYTLHGDADILFLETRAFWKIQVWIRCPQGSIPAVDGTSAHYDTATKGVYQGL